MPSFNFTAYGYQLATDYLVNLQVLYKIYTKIYILLFKNRLKII